MSDTDRYWLTPNREVVDLIASLGSRHSTAELAIMWADIGYWANKRRRRWVMASFCNEWGISPSTAKRQVQFLEDCGAICTTSGGSKEAIIPPWSGSPVGQQEGQQRPTDGVTVAPIHTQVSKSKSQSLSTQQQEEMLRIWNSQCDQKSYLIRHKSVTSDAQRAARKHLQDFPDVALGAAVGSYLNEAERWMRKRYQETQRKFSLRAVLMFPTFGDHLNAAEPVAPHSVESPPPDDEHPLLKPHDRSSDYGRLAALRPRPGVLQSAEVKAMSAEQMWNIHREAWAMYTDTPHPNESIAFLGYNQWGPHWPEL